MPRWKVQCKVCGLYLGRWPYSMQSQARKVAQEHRALWHKE